MQIERLDHLVLTVKDVYATCEFYVRFLGMRVETFKGDRKALHFGNQKINLHPAGHEHDPKAEHPIPGSADLCFITELPILKVQAELMSNGIKIVEGPVERSGAKGTIFSIYIRDPDLNLIEIANYI